MKTSLKRYVLIHKPTFQFLGNDGDLYDRIDFAERLNSVDEAIEERDECDIPSDFEIRELDIIYDLGKIIEN